MTREEVISFLQSRIDLIDKNYPQIEDYREALDMAIKALKQEPCEDCISRKQAIKATYGFERYTGIDEAPYEYAESILRDLPPVTPKGVTVTDFADKCRECGREKVLDKIRAEIEQEYKNECEHPYGQGLNRAIEILDKYKTEREEENE